MAQDVVESIIDKQEVRDELLEEPDVTPIFFAYDDFFTVIQGITSLSTRDIADSFILTSASNGILGTIKLGDRSGALIVIRVVNPDNKYKEKFLDSALEDTGVTTAIWDTTGHKLDFTAGEVAQSEIIALNPPEIYSSANMTVTAPSADLAFLTLKMSSDGGATFETVTNGEDHAFTAKDATGLKWRIESSGTASVTKVTIIYGV